MKITSEAVRKDIAAIWPDLQFILLSDPAWWDPDVAEVQEFLQTSGIEKLPYIEGIHECEEFSLQLVAELRRRRAEKAVAGMIPKNELLNWPFGFVFGTRFAGRDLDHWMGITHTRQGLWLIEPQTDAIWTPSRDRDQVLFLFM